MGFSFRRASPLLLIALIIIYDDTVSIPSCQIVPHGHVDQPDHPDDLKVVMVSDLLLLGSPAAYFDLFFTNHYLSNFFKKSFETLKPDMMLVLGDISGRGSELTQKEWSSLLKQFHDLVGPFLALPFHITLGDRDIGQCTALNPEKVKQIASVLPGLDSSGCGAFEISNITFLSLNSVALLCGNNKVRFSVEKVVERESIELRTDEDNSTGNEFDNIRISKGNSGWRENAMSAGSGPVLLLHFPLYRTVNSNCWGDNSCEIGSKEISYKEAKASTNRDFARTRPYDVTLPLNATEYIFQALRPRIIFSGHGNKFCDWTHPDGTREITVPPLSWAAKDDPAFIIVTFRSNGRTVSVSHCSLAKQSRVLFTSVIFIIVYIFSLFVTRTAIPTNSQT